jgi:peptidoglycan/LPS O-acetylase OafA/YrhL
LDRVPAINGLRGIAILAVLFCHVVAGTMPRTGPFLALAGIDVPLSPLLTNGWTGVNLFFILSGFVLYLPYAAGERAMADWHDGFAFYRRRARRLLPLFYVAALAVLALHAAHGITAEYLDEAAWLLSLAFMLSARHFGPAFNIPLWSIGVELLFSLIFPAIVLRARSLGLPRWLAIAVALSLAARVVGYLAFPNADGASYQADNIACRLDEFVLGMMLARLHVEGRLPRRAGLFGAAGIGMIAAAWVGFDLALHGVWPALARAALNDVLDAGFAAVIVAALAPGSRVEAALSLAPLQVLGMMCYSLYIWHWPVLMALAPDRGAMSWPAFAAASAAFLALTLAIAAVTYRFVEFRHVRDWRHLFLLDAAAAPLIPPARPV